MLKTFYIAAASAALMTTSTEGNNLSKYVPEHVQGAVDPSLVLDLAQTDVVKAMNKRQQKIKDITNQLMTLANLIEE